jgi:hypothetical protein
MNDEIIETISHGDIYILKQLPKTLLTHNISKVLMDNLKNNLIQVENRMNTAETVDSEFNYVVCNFSYKLKNIEECIVYLEKIK